MTRGIMGRQSPPAARSAGGGSVLAGGVGGRQRAIVEVVGNDRALTELVRRLIRTESLILNAAA
jgi:hypothetical protein